MSAAVVVCTLGRPDELRACLKSIGAQQLLPALVVVVDASTPEVFAINAASVAQLQTTLATTEIRHVAASAGLTSQRNRGCAEVRRSPNISWIQFVDDDVELSTGYLGAIGEVLDHAPKVVGIEGRDVGMTATPRPVMRRLYPRLSAVSLLSRTGHNWFSESQTARGVDWLSGCAAAYRIGVVKALQFDMRRVAGGHGEDVDFSYRATALGTLWYDPAITYHHRPTLRNRASGAKLARQVAAHRRLLSTDFPAIFPPRSVTRGLLIEGTWAVVAAALRRDAQRLAYGSAMFSAGFRSLAAR